MFAKLAAICIAALAASTTVLAGPIAARSTELTSRSERPSFNRWGGFESLDRFDDFYGKDNFSNNQFEQIVIRKDELVCRRVDVRIIQQRLAVLQELAKKIISEQICEVETQVIVFQQFHGSLGNFNRDLRRDSGKQAGFDFDISRRYNEIFREDGGFSDHDFGFSGKDVGRNTFVVNGNNWDDSRSRKSVGDAFSAAKGAFVSFD